MTDYTQTFTISSDSWTDIGLGPLTVEVLTTTSVFLDAADEAPPITDEDHVIAGDGTNRSRMEFAQETHIWARAARPGSSAKVEVSTGRLGSQSKPMSVIEGLSIPKHDFIGMNYTGAVLSSVVYKTGGASGTVVASVAMAYDSSGNLTSVTRS